MEFGLPEEEDAPVAAADARPVRPPSPVRFAEGATAPAAEEGLPEGVTTVEDPGVKPVYVPDAGTSDPVAHSVAETLFWMDMLAEHAAFLSWVMPGPELEGRREEAASFRRAFEERFQAARSGNLSTAECASFNRATAELIRPFAAFQRALAREQQAGRLRSLAWPFLLDHGAEESDRVLKRLARLESGDADYDRDEVIVFWSRMTDEHSRLLTHLLDPEEARLIGKARTASERFRELRRRHPAPSPRDPDDPALRAADQSAEFYAALQRAVVGGQVRGILDPALADHFRRQAIKFADELRRTGLR